MRGVRLGLLLLLTTALIACGPPRKSVFPPSISVQQVRILPNGAWQLTVRIQNNSYGEMDFSAIEGQLQLAALVPVRVHARFDRDIPALAGDVLPITVLPTPDMSAALAAIDAKGSAGSVPYNLSGVATATPEKEDASRDFPFHGDDWLSPVPGISHTYR